MEERTKGFSIQPKKSITNNNNKSARFNKENNGSKEFYDFKEKIDAKRKCRKKWKKFEQFQGRNGTRIRHYFEDNTFTF